MTRTYQATTTRFNVYYNGIISYNEGLKNILKANKEDYSNIIPMYPISHHSNASAAITNMDLTIEKCRKAIKLHSIKIKPQKNYKKENLPEYKLFYNQQEFNPALKDAWLLLGKAEFHKADFLGSVGTFSYIIRHYTSDNDMEATCQLWIARAYGEMGWIYEAEQILSKIDQDHLRHSNIGLFASVNADLLLKKHQYKDAIPFLELALSKETDSNLKLRFNFILAQLFQKTKDNKAAFDTYTKVIKSNPPYEMDFNAQINRAQLEIGQISVIRKELVKMTKNRNNRDYLDQIYFALGNTYLNHADTLKAIDNYKLSIEKSTRNGIDKAETYITLGDIYYKRRKYVLAQPCYDEAGKIITNENEDYERVTRLGDMLSELVTQNDIVVLQDSLQRLSAMSESQRLQVINKLIEKLNADEKAAADKELKDKEQARANAEDNFATIPPIGGAPGSAGDWYFYNVDLMRNGEMEFVKKWGKRKLEDNWRRTNKATSLFAEENTNKTSVKDSTDTISKSKVLTDKKKPEFYLSQIPVTPAQLAKSTAEIATALFSMGDIYKDKIEDIPMSISTYEEFIRRFKNDERVPDAYFNIYLMETKNGNQQEANLYRSKLMAEYPKSKYIKILSQTDYAEQMERLNKVQDSIYTLTYRAYNENDYKTVYAQVAYMKQNYPYSTLLPKFLFLNALSIGKNESSALFSTSLNELVNAYPQSDVSGMAKDILALMKQGQQTRTGTSSGSLITLRDEQTTATINENAPQQFSTDKQTKHRILFISSANQSSMNKLLYNIASFNFSRFMIKDFDLVINKIDSTQNALSVTNLESYEEAVWYENSIASDEFLSKLMNDLNVQKVIISEENYALLKTNFKLKDYLAFESNTTVNKQNNQFTDNRLNKKQANVSNGKNKATNAPVKVTEVSMMKPEKPAESPTNKTVANSSGKPVDKMAVNKTDSLQAVTKPQQRKSIETNGTETVENKLKAENSSTSGKKQEDKTAKEISQNTNNQIKNGVDTIVKTKQDKALKPAGIPSKIQAPLNQTTAVNVPVKGDGLNNANGVKQEAKEKAPEAIAPKEDKTPLFKGLFGFKANEPHYVAIYIVSGIMDFEKVKAAFNDYNSKNYPVMNLKVSLETVDKRQIIIIGSLADAQVAKSYLLRMVKDKTLFEGLKGTNYRNLIGSQKNLNVLVQQNALNQYFEFMQQYYLK